MFSDSYNVIIASNYQKANELSRPEFSKHMIHLSGYTILIRYLFGGRQYSIFKKKRKDNLKKKETKDVSHKGLY